jgi:hypothetical protein
MISLRGVDHRLLLGYVPMEWITPTGHRHVTRPYDCRGDADPP